MTDSAYDPIAASYSAFVRRGLADETSVLYTATQTVLRLVADPTDKVICDVACGQGHLSVRLAETARLVIGVDRSAKLIALAQQAAVPNVRYAVDDAQMLQSQGDAQFDIVVCNLALMDIPDLAAVYTAVQRILRVEGRFIFSITHPCFQAPHASTQADEQGAFQARCISTYASEGPWRSQNAQGIRGQVGAQHRTISTYLNEAARAGFTLLALEEPTLPHSDYDTPNTQAHVEIPAVMVVALRK